MSEVRLIDANALKKAFDKWWGCDDIPATVVEDIIDNAPTVDKGYDFGYADGHGEGYELGKNSRPHGEWVIEKNTTFEFYMKCSNCDHPAEWLDGESQLLSNFCPNCGADMRGDENDNN